MTCGDTKIPVIPQMKHNEKEGKARSLGEYLKTISVYYRLKERSKS